MEFENRYGREACCCSQECSQEFGWRLTLSILGKPYRLNPNRIKAAEEKIEPWCNTTMETPIHDRPTLPDEVAEHVRLTPREKKAP